VVGRFIFGFGGESIFVAQSKYGSRWFRADQMSFFYGIIVSFARLGSVFNFALMPLIADVYLPLSVWLGTLMCTVSLLAAIGAAFIDKKGEKLGLVLQLKEKEATLQQVLSSFKEILDFPLIFWVIVIISSTFFPAFVLFLATASYTFQKTGQHYSPHDSSLFLSVPNIICIILPPLFGIVVDKFGFSLYWTILGIFFKIVGLSIYLALSVNMFVVHPIVIMVFIGVGYSFFIASFWTLVPFVVDESKVGRAYGIMTSLQNVGYIVVPNIIAVAQSSSRTDIYSQFIFPIDVLLVCATIAFVFSIVLYILDLTRNGGILNANGDLKQMWRDKLNGLIEEDQVDVEMSGRFQGSGRFERVI